MNALILASASSRLAHLVPVAVACGARQGELFALDWRDVSEDSLHITKSLEEIDGRLVIKADKSERGRTVPLVGPARESLRSAPRGSPLVFPDSRGGLLRKSNFHRQFWGPWRIAAGCPHLHFHDLRHTTATWLLEAGVPLNVVQAILGHASASTTLDFYAHVTRQGIDAAREVMEKKLGCS